MILANHWRIENWLHYENQMFRFINQTIQIHVLASGSLEISASIITKRRLPPPPSWSYQWIVVMCGRRGNEVATIDVGFIVLVWKVRERKWKPNSDWWGWLVRDIRFQPICVVVHEYGVKCSSHLLQTKF